MVGTLCIARKLVAKSVVFNGWNPVADNVVFNVWAKSVVFNGWAKSVVFNVWALCIARKLARNVVFNV